MRLLVSTLVLFSLVACSSEQPRSAEAIRAAVQSYLTERSDLALANMQVAVDRVKYEGDRAQAEVTISASNDAKASMQMAYELEQTADGWRVIPAAPAGHGEGGFPPPASGGAGGLPPGHPPTDAPPQGGGEQLPPGHPPL